MGCKMYHTLEGLIFLNLRSLEERRLHDYMNVIYKLYSGLLSLNVNDFFY